MLTIDRANNMLVAERDQIVVRYRRLLPDGSISTMLGEVYAMVLSGPGIETRTAVGTPGADLDGAFLEMRFASSVGSLLAGKVGLRWKVVEVLPGDAQDTRFVGLLTVERSPAADVDAPLVGDGEILMLIDDDRPGGRVRTSSRGARGLASFEARYLAGRIAEPTEQAEDAYLRSLATGVGQRQIKASGLAMGGGAIENDPTVSVEPATDEDAIAGTRTDRALTPKAGKAALDAQSNAILALTGAALDQRLRLDADQQLDLDRRARGRANLNAAELIPPRTVTATAAARDGETLTADTTGGSFSVALPNDPAPGQRVVIRDKGLSWGTNPLAITADKPIAAPLDDGIANAGGYELAFSFDGALWTAAISYIYGG